MQLSCFQSRPFFTIFVVHYANCITAFCSSAIFENPGKLVVTDEEIASKIGTSQSPQVRRQLSLVPILGRNFFIPSRITARWSLRMFFSKRNTHVFFSLQEFPIICISQLEMYEMHPLMQRSMSFFTEEGMEKIAVASCGYKMITMIISKEEGQTFSVWKQQKC